MYYGEPFLAQPLRALHSVPNPFPSARARCRGNIGRSLTKTLVPPGDTSRRADSSAKPFCPILPCHEEGVSPG